MIVDEFWDWLTQTQIVMINITDTNTAIHPIFFVPIDAIMLSNKIKDMYVLHTKLRKFQHRSFKFFLNPAICA